jgi:hypothetical protein
VNSENRETLCHRLQTVAILEGISARFGIVKERLRKEDQAMRGSRGVD